MHIYVNQTNQILPLQNFPNLDFELIAKLLKLGRESIIGETLAPLVVVTR